MFSLNIKVYFGLMMIIFLAVSTGGCAKHNMEAYSQLSEAGGNIVENDCEHERLSENENWSVEDEREFNK